MTREVGARVRASRTASRYRRRIVPTRHRRTRRYVRPHASRESFAPWLRELVSTDSLRAARADGRRCGGADRRRGASNTCGAGAERVCRVRRGRCLIPAAMRVHRAPPECRVPLSATAWPDPVPHPDCHRRSGCAACSVPATPGTLQVEKLRSRDLATRFARVLRHAR